jgi:N-acyl-D-amino-acid deacylase
MIRRLCLSLFLSIPLLAADYDLLIRNARVVDGAGNPWFRADVAVKNGKIAAIGRLSAASAARSIDAQGRVVAPGFIDIHTHVEDGVEKVPGGDNYVMDGVTTVVTGNCGGSEDDLGAWFPKLEKIGLGLNVASLIGHNTVRRQVMGSENRQATPDEIAKMQVLVEKGMRDGAAGFSTGLIYIPGTYANTDEVIALAKAAARYGGIYASHMRDEGAKVLDAITEACQVGKQAGVPVQLAHFKIDNRRLWGSSEKSIALVEKFRREGVDVSVDQYPYDQSSTGLGIVLPSWAFAGGKLRDHLKDPATRARLKREMLAMLKALGHKDYSYATVASFPAEKSYEGQTISAINRMKSRKKGARNEADTIFDLMENRAPQMVYHSMSLKDVERILRYPNAAVGSDGGIREFGVGVPHPRSYGTRSRVLAEFVRNRGVITLEDAIRKMTSLPARTLGFRDRGMLREGYAADLVLFDPAKVQDKATFQQPHQYSEGYDLVLVNGVAVVENGKLTGARPGKVLRNPGTEYSFPIS